MWGFHQLTPAARGKLHPPHTSSTHFQRGDVVYLRGTEYANGSQYEIVRALRDTALSRILFLPEHFGREGFNQRYMFPSIWR